MRWWHEAPWRPRSLAFIGVEASLAWISGSYGLNLVMQDHFRSTATPNTVDALEQVAPLQAWGAALVVGAALLVVGFLARWPYLIVAGHVAQLFVLTVLGVVFVEVNSLNQTALVLGLFLHPVMGITVARDAGSALGVTERE